MSEKRNIEFLPGKIRYNAIKKFKNHIIKIPSYVIKEVFKNKSKIEIYHNGRFQASYDYDNLFDSIKEVEPKEYKGKFRNKNIIYKLNHVSVAMGYHGN